MTEAVIVRGVSIGTGRPKICVPITSVSREEICQKARELSGLPFDLVEWRADWYEGVEEQGQAAEVLKDLRNILGDVPISIYLSQQKRGRSERTGYCRLPGFKPAGSCIRLCRSGGSGAYDRFRGRRRLSERNHFFYESPGGKGGDVQP